jgi:hypothetical protein
MNMTQNDKKIVFAVGGVFGLVAAADGQITKDETNACNQLLETFPASEKEKNIMTSGMISVINNPVEINSVCKPLKNLSTEAQESILESLVDLAAVDLNIHKSEYTLLCQIAREFNKLNFHIDDLMVRKGYRKIDVRRKTKGLLKKLGKFTIGVGSQAGSIFSGIFKPESSNPFQSSLETDERIFVPPRSDITNRPTTSGSDKEGVSSIADQTKKRSGNNFSQKNNRSRSERVAKQTKPTGNTKKTWEQKRREGVTSYSNGHKVKGGLLPKRGNINNITLYFDGKFPTIVGSRNGKSVCKTDKNLQVFFKNKIEPEKYEFSGHIVDLYFDK